VTELDYIRKRDWWLWVFDPNYVEHRKYPDWSDFLPFYQSKCNKHGDFVNYLQGSRKHLYCPKCREEK